jgi:imidazolonepropionase-like amidohydrolase
VGSNAGAATDEARTGRAAYLVGDAVSTRCYPTGCPCPETGEAGRGETQEGRKEASRQEGKEEGREKEVGQEAAGAESGSAQAGPQSGQEEERQASPALAGAVAVGYRGGGRRLGRPLGFCRPTVRPEAPRMIRRTTAVIAVVLAAGLSVACPSPGKGKTVYSGATVFDGTGAPVLRNAVIIVGDGHIETMGPADEVKIPRGAEVVDVTGRWIIPGLIDSHTHVARWALRPYLAYGVTTVRDLGGEQDSVLFLRTDVRNGTADGPRILLSGAMIDGAPATWPGATAVRTPHDARRAVGNRVGINASQVKIYTKLDRRLLEPLLDEAKALETPVAAHLGRVDAITAARLGVRTIEHLSGVVTASVANAAPLIRAHDDFFAGWNLEERSWAGLDSATLTRTARALAQTNVVLVPTLAVHEMWGRMQDSAFTGGLDLTAVPPAMIEAWNVPDLVRRARITAADYPAFQRSRPNQDLFIRAFRSAGGTVIAGSDSPNQLLPPGASLHRELSLLVRAGLSPKDALLAATRDPARLLGVGDTIGVVRAGAVADFVVLTADPLVDIANVALIQTVVAYGLPYDPRELKRPR